MILFPLPRELVLILQAWNVDKKSGNVQLNIQGGVIRGFHENVIHTIKP